MLMFHFSFPLFPSQHLNNLLEHYLEPLKRETFLSSAEITALFGNIQEIVTFQRQFLQNLEEALEIEPDFHRFEHSSQFKVSLIYFIFAENIFHD
jgi:T-lymphoma invasion and metastasis-inducing protein 1